MSSILIKNADIVTLDEKGTILTNTDLWIEGKRIKNIGEKLTIEADEVIDARGQVVMPGFFNAHCHSPMTLERGWAEDLPFPRWLNEKIWVAESVLTSDDVYWGAMLASVEMIRSGTIAYNDHYFHMPRVAEVVKQSGMKATLGDCVFGIGADKEIGGGLEESLDFLERYHGAANGRIRTVLAPHSHYICPEDFLKTIVKHAERTGQPIHLHVAESWPQVENNRQRHGGTTPVEYLRNLGVFEHHTIAAHTLAVTDEDIDILAKNHVHSVRTTITYMKLAMPANSVTPLMDAGINIALGTDGPGSNNDLDIFAQMRQTALLEKYQNENPELLAGDIPLRMATQNGAKAMGFPESGVIEIGAPADIIMVDFNQAALRPRHSLLANLVYSTKGHDVTHTIVDGQILMRERQLTTLDEAEIIEQAEKHAFRMVNQDMTLKREYKA